MQESKYSTIFHAWGCKQSFIMELGKSLSWISTSFQENSQCWMLSKTPRPKLKKEVCCYPEKQRSWWWPAQPLWFASGSEELVPRWRGSSSPSRRPGSQTPWPTTTRSEIENFLSYLYFEVDLILKYTVKPAYKDYHFKGQISIFIMYLSTFEQGPPVNNSRNFWVLSVVVVHGFDCISF